MSTKKLLRFLVTPALHRAIRADAALRDVRIVDVVESAMSDFIDNQREISVAVPASFLITSSDDRQIFVDLDDDVLDRFKNDAKNRGLRVSQIARIALAARYADVEIPSALAAAVSR
jgi:hypothetical protein